MMQANTNHIFTVIASPLLQRGGVVSQNNGNAWLVDRTGLPRLSARNDGNKLIYQGKRIVTFAAGLLIFMGVLSIAGCTEVTHPFPPFERQHHLTVEERQHTEQLSLETVAGQKGTLGKAVAAMAQSWRHDGDGMIHVTVAASPGAAEQAARIVSSALRGAGIASKNIMVTKVDAWPRGVTMSYRALAVVEPDCAEYPIGDAPMGCAMDRHLARMIARPSDLLGRDTLGPVPAARLGDPVRRYHNFEAPVVIQNPLVPTTNAGAEGD